MHAIPPESEAALEPLFLRLAFSDRQTLNAYLSGKTVELDDIWRQLFVSERALDYRLPDHYFKNLREFMLRDIDSYADFVLKTFERLGESFFYWRGDRLFVRDERFEAWQHAVPRFSPLAVSAYAIWRRGREPGRSVSTPDEWVTRYLAPHFHASSLPTVHNPALDDMIREEGLCDLHIHLNGSTELDHVWLDAILRPEAFYAFIKDTATREEVREHYSQIDPDLDPSVLVAQLRVARRLRRAISEYLLNDADPDRSLLWNKLAKDVYHTWDDDLEALSHPLSRHYPALAKHGDMVIEGLFYVLAFERIAQTKDSTLARALHCYLLILGLFAPLCVQQVEQFGFDQFQKFTFNGMRELSETSYQRRFEQMSYSRDGDLTFVEGRFAPKVHHDKAAKLFHSMMKGFADHHGAKVDLTSAVLIQPSKRADFRLIAHFIKLDELSKAERSTYCRFHELRTEHHKALRLLAAMREQLPAVNTYLTGIDAAANELHTPPDVFAPLFRACRYLGINNFTYHVGEDFDHLLAGIRAVYEAIVYLDLRGGNRIGHGTAVGICPHLYIDRTPARLVRRRGDWLDDLIFAYRMLLEVPGAQASLPRLKEEIDRHALHIYKRIIPFRDLWTAWRLRALDPLVALDSARSSTNAIFWNDDMELQEVERAKRETPDAFQLFCAHHEKEHVERSRELIEVDTAFFPPSQLRALQDRVLAKLNAQGVVIESLPTSNVRISLYDRYSEHHIFRWLGLDGHAGPCPIVCLGTDDPGIFATNLRNEYAHLYRELRTNYNRNEAEAMAILRELNRNSRTYAFRHKDGAGTLRS